MNAIFKREFRSYFSGMTGWVFSAFVLLFSGIFTMVINLMSAYSNFEYVLSNMTFIYLLAIPILTMRLFAEERRQKTETLLYSLPMPLTKVVLGKYFAALTALASPFAVMLFYPLILSQYGSVNLLSAYSGIIGFVLLGASLISIGMFVSTLTENQIISAVLCFAVILVNYFLTDLSGYLPSSAEASMFAFVVVIALVAFGFYKLAKSGAAAIIAGVIGEVILLVFYLIKQTAFEDLFPTILSKLSLFDRFYIFADGMFDLTAVIYFATVCALFIFFTVQALEKRRWN